MEVTSVWPTGWTGNEAFSSWLSCFFPWWPILPNLDQCPNAPHQVTRATAKYRHKMSAQHAVCYSLSTTCNCYGDLTLQCFSKPFVLHQRGRIRPQRWIVTIPSFDQWLQTIENHRHSIGTNGCLTKKPLPFHWFQWMLSKPFIQWQWWPWKPLIFHNGSNQGAKVSGLVRINNLIINSGRISQNNET